MCCSGHVSRRQNILTTERGENAIDSAIFSGSKGHWIEERARKSEELFKLTVD